MTLKEMTMKCADETIQKLKERVEGLEGALRDIVEHEGSGEFHMWAAKIDRARAVLNGEG